MDIFECCKSAQTLSFTCRLRTNTVWHRLAVALQPQAAEAVQGDNGLRHRDWDDERHILRRYILLRRVDPGRAQLRRH